MAPTFLRFPDLWERKGIPWTRSYINRLEKAGKFPVRVKLGPNTIAWREDEIDAWLQSRERAQLGKATEAA